MWAKPATSPSLEEIDKDMAFIFLVESSDKTVSMEVTVIGNGSVTIRDLPYGAYTVTELEGWSWRYQPTDSDEDGNPDWSQSIENPMIEGLNTLKFKNERINEYWLDGNSNEKNVFGSRLLNLFR